MSTSRKILYLCPALPLSANHSGAASRYVQNLKSLCALGHQVRVLRFWGSPPALQPLSAQSVADDPEVLRSAESLRLIHVAPLPEVHRKFRRVWQSFSDPFSFIFPWGTALAAALTKEIEEWLPDLIWAEGQELSCACALSSPPRAWVYSQHDLLFRLRRLRMNRRPGWRDHWWLWACRRAERRLVRLASGVVTGSTSEAGFLGAWGGANVQVIPIAYDLPQPCAREELDARPRIVHLGSLGTTSNRVGLEAYLRVVHPRLTDCPHTLCVIGDSSEAPSRLRELLSASGAQCVGFASELETALHPFDLAILPYEHDTGYRTKLPLLLAHRQVVVATRAAVAGTSLPGLEKVCILCDSLNAMPAAIARLFRSPSERRQLGNAAKTFFESHFLSHNCYPHYERFIAKLSMSPAGIS